MDKYCFSLANECDIAEILKLYQGYIGSVGCNWNLEYPDEEIIALDIEHNSMYILKDDTNKIISVATARSDEEFEQFEWTPKNPCGLSRFAVLPTIQNQGIGRTMLQKVMDAVKDKGFDGFIMFVSVDNPSALSLYEKMGFKRCGQTPFYEHNYYRYELVL